MACGDWPTFSPSLLSRYFPTCGLALLSERNELSCEARRKKQVPETALPLAVGNGRSESE